MKRRKFLKKIAKVIPVFVAAPIVVNELLKSTTTSDLEIYGWEDHRWSDGKFDNRPIIQRDTYHEASNKLMAENKLSMFDFLHNHPTIITE